MYPSARTASSNLVSNIASGSAHDALRIMRNAQPHRWRSPKFNCSRPRALPYTIGWFVNSFLSVNQPQYATDESVYYPPYTRLLYHLFGIEGPFEICQARQ
ncbi:hypothetical protein BJV78DRAFT_435508 [Lactifluus subvellereus]|nr:hypothetical protein BJV78DRAFT_435508 [Lactifluus subvellereus]